MDIELYTYYYDSLQTLLHIKANSANTSDNINSGYTKDNIKWLMKQLFSNTNCKYCDFNDLLINHSDLCSAFLHDYVRILSRHGFEVFSHHKNYLPYLTASKFFDAKHFNELIANKIVMYDYKQILNPEIIDMFLDHGAGKSYISKNPNLSQANIDKILLEPRLGHKMGLLYYISQNNSFEYDGLKYNHLNKDKTELFNYISDVLIDLNDFKTFINYPKQLYYSFDFDLNFPLNTDRLEVILSEKNMGYKHFLGNKSLTIDLLNMIIEKESIQWIMSINYKYLATNPSIPIEYKNKLNAQYYKELVFK